MCDRQETKKFPDVIELNVGGTPFTTSLMTLTKCDGNMLSAMFSGKYNVMIDKNGRYFIDADGSNFIYILNYLRYGDLPPLNLVDTIYREALYFGIGEMIQELERMPSILAKLQRNKFRENFPMYHECLELIVNTVADVKVKDTSTEIAVLLFAKENNPPNEDFNKNHMCIHKSVTGKTVMSIAKLGPWKLSVPEKEVMNCLMFDLQDQGFVVTSSFLGGCDYSFEGIACEKLFYKVCFHWWKH